MIVVNLFAGPGAGKSTTAAGLFHLMKTKGHSVELVTEFAKELTWSKNFGDLQNQLHVLANQEHRLARLRGKVDYAITDSPLLFSSLYAHGRYNQDWFHTFVRKVFDEYHNINFLVKRYSPYQPEGRNETYEEAVELDRKLINLIDSIWLPYSEVQGDNEAAQTIYKQLMENTNAYHPY